MPANVHGGYGKACETALSVGDPTTSHISSEMWLLFGNYWTEAGIGMGDSKDSNGTIVQVRSPTLFWADSNTQYGYNFHPEGGAISGIHYDVEITYSGAEPWWTVDVNGGNHNSWHQASYGNELQTGAEWADGTGSSVHESGSVNNLSWQDLNGNWWTPWGPADGGGGDAPLTGFWYQTRGTYYSTRTTNEGWSC
jgi:hypothetical protein